MVITKNAAGLLDYKITLYTTNAANAVYTTTPGSGGTQSLIIKATTYSRTSVSGMVDPKFIVVKSQKGKVNIVFLNESQVEVGRMYINIADNDVASLVPLDVLVDEITLAQQNRLGLGGLDINGERIIFSKDSDGTYSAYIGKNWNTYTDNSLPISDILFAMSSVTPDQIAGIQAEVDECNSKIDALMPLASQVKSYYVSR